MSVMGRRKDEPVFLDAGVPEMFEEAVGIPAPVRMHPPLPRSPSQQVIPLPPAAQCCVRRAGGSIVGEPLAKVEAPEGTQQCVEHWLLALECATVSEASVEEGKLLGGSRRGCSRRAGFDGVDVLDWSICDGFKADKRCG